MPFSGKIVLVTGAGSGVGRGLAVGFCTDGAEVVSIGRTEADLRATAALCDGRMRYVVGDVGREQDVDRLFREVDEVGDRVDVLVNNAAEYPKRNFLDSSHAEWARTLETNVVGLAYCCRKALPGMLDRGHGRIINMGSFAWKGPIPASSGYSASKGAVSAFTKALASEIDRQRYPDVLVNELLAGVYRTRMSETGEDPADAYPHARTVASLPSGGPHGEIFLGSEIFREESGGVRARLKRLLGLS